MPSRYPLQIKLVKLYIRNMVCIRCKMIVREVLTKLGLSVTFVELGEAQLLENISEYQREQIRSNLLTYGLELMEDQKSMLIEKIKNVIIELVHYTEEPLAVNLSEYLHQQTQLDYTYLSNLFSEVQGTTNCWCIMSCLLLKLLIKCIIVVLPIYLTNSEKLLVLHLLTLNN